MKRIVAVVVLVMLISNCTYSLIQYRVYNRGDIIAFNNKVGDVLDAEERTEYDVFPDIEGFKEARFYAIPDGGYEVEIVTDRGKYIGVSRDVQADQILRDYFSRYHSAHFNQSDFQKRWKIVTYDALGLPITEREISRNTKPWCLIGGALGCGLVSFGASFALASVIALGELSSQHSGENDELYVAGIIGGTVAGMFTGVLVGRMVEYRRALNAIKKARKPRVVE